MKPFECQDIDPVYVFKRVGHKYGWKRPISVSPLGIQITADDMSKSEIIVIDFIDLQKYWRYSIDGDSWFSCEKKG